MLSVLMEIDDIDYEGTAANVFPRLVERAGKRENPRPYEKLLLSLKGDPAELAHKVLAQIPASDKDKVVAWLVCRESDALCSGFNDYLEERLGKGNAKVGRVRAVQGTDTRLSVLATDIEVNYHAVLESPLVNEKLQQMGIGLGALTGGLLKGAAKLISKVPGETLEKRGMSLMESDRTRSKVASVLSNALHQMGILMHMRDVQVDNRGKLRLQRTEDLKETTAAVEAILVKAIKACL